MPIKLTVVLEGEKMRIPLKPAQTVQALANDLLERVERVNGALAASLRSGERRFVSLTRQRDDAVVAHLPLDRLVALETRVANGDTILVNLSAPEVLVDEVRFAVVVRCLVCAVVWLFSHAASHGTHTHSRSFARTLRTHAAHARRAPRTAHARAALTVGAPAPQAARQQKQRFEIVARQSAGADQGPADEQAAPAAAAARARAAAHGV